MSGQKLYVIQCFVYTVIHTSLSSDLTTLLHKKQLLSTKNVRLVPTVSADPLLPEIFPSALLPIVSNTGKLQLPARRAAAAFLLRPAL
jgi:hypothetical protein